MTVRTGMPALSPTVRVSGKATPDQIRRLKQHVIDTTKHVGFLKAQVAASQLALAAVNPADANAVVVPGYPPPAV